MNVLYLSPNFPTHNWLFAKKLMEHSVNVLGVGDAPYEGFTEAQKDALTEYYRVESLEDYDSVYRAVAFYTHRYGRIDRIVSMNPHWLPLEEALRDDYAMSGGPQNSLRLKQGVDFDVTYEALVDGEGAPVLAMSRVVYGDEGSYTLAKPDRSVQSIGQKIISEMGIKSGFITVELIKTPEGYEAVNSYAAPSVFAPDMMNYAFDFDVYSAWVHIVTGGKQKKAERKNTILFIHFADSKQYPNLSSEFFSQLEQKLIQSSPASDAIVGKGDNTVYILRLDNEAQAEKMLADFVGEEKAAEKKARTAMKKPAAAKKTTPKAVKPRKKEPIILDKKPGRRKTVSKEAPEIIVPAPDEKYAGVQVSEEKKTVTVGKK